MKEFLPQPSLQPQAQPPPVCLGWPLLLAGTLVRRYKRFIADVELEDGTQVRAHCPNPGRMTGCADPGRPVYLSVHDQPHRKLKYTWEMIEMPSSLVGVNALVPNRLAARAIEAGAIGPLAGYRDLATERPMGRSSRVDLELSSPGRRTCLVEVKSCTLVDGATALFPDAVTARGLRHARELAAALDEGCRAVILFIIQRMDAMRFSPADTIDPAWGEGLRRAAEAGVEVLAWDTVLTRER
ncbi:MAG: DNA/RNA nuclease SfsA, partial [Pseudomonadota bacterium]